MDILAEYKLSGRHGDTMFRRTRLTGLIPLAVIVAIMIFRPGLPPPPYWFALSLVLGFQLILQGSYELYHTDGKRTRLGIRLTRTIDTWYPMLTFLVQTFFVVTLFYVLWITIVDLGFPASIWEQSIVITLLVIVPINRLIHFLANDLNSHRLHFIDDLIRCIITILVTLLLGHVLLWFMTPENPQWWKFPIERVVVILVEAVVIVVNVILIADRIVRPRPK